jgi:hypothetical protein
LDTRRRRAYSAFGSASVKRLAGKPDASHQYVKDHPSIDITVGASTPADQGLLRAGGATTDWDPSSRFLTALTGFASYGFVGLLHPTADPGVHQVSLSGPACLPNSKSSSLVLHPPERSPPPAASLASPRATAPLPLAIPRVGSTSRRCSAGESVACRLRFRGRHARCSPGLPQLEAHGNPSPPKRLALSALPRVGERGAVSRDPGRAQAHAGPKWTSLCAIRPRGKPSRSTEPRGAPRWLTSPAFRTRRPAGHGTTNPPSPQCSARQAEDRVRCQTTNPNHAPGEGVGAAIRCLTACRDNAEASWGGLERLPGANRHRP